MSELDWRRIDNGATFQTLVGAIVVRRDEHARPFGKPGRDGAIDTISRDHARVYQAKFRTTWTKRQLKTEAFKELKRIKEYRQKSHTNYALWAKVSEWYLVTNERRGRLLEALWSAEVEPAFTAVGIKAIWWSQDDIEAWLLGEAPGLQQAFFKGETRCFLTQVEVARRDQYLTAEPVGRHAELAELERHLSGGESPLLLCHGPDGVGKTHLLWALGQRALAAGQDVWWATEELGHHGQWYAHVIAERPALIIADELDDLLVRRLVAQVTTKRAQWTIIASRRSDDAVVIDSLKPQKLAIDPLDPQAGALLAGHILPGLQETDTEVIARVADGFPQWILLACDLVKTGLSLQDLPTDPNGLAHLAMRRFVEAAGDPALLRWIALLQPINVEEDTGVAFLAAVADLSPDATILRLEALTEAGQLAERGRLRAIKPDVIRDAILHDWLVDPRRPHNAARAAERVVTVILRGCDGHRLNVAGAVASLARVEMQARLRRRDALKVDLLGIIDTTLTGLAQLPTIDARLNALTLANEIRAARPLTVVRLVQRLRTHEAAPQTVTGLLGPKTLDQDTILDALPWALYGSAGYICEPDDQRLLVDEMIALLRVQAQREGLPKTMWFGGKSPGDLLPRLIDGESWFLESYRASCADAAHALLDALGQGESTGDLQAFELLVTHLTGAESRWTQWRGDSVRFGRGLSNDPAMWAIRYKLLMRLWVMVVDAHLPSPARAAGWRCLTEAHNNAWRAANEFKEHARAPDLFDEVRADLKRLATLLDGGQMTPAEKLLTIKIWHWYTRYADDEDTGFVALAMRCEALTWQDPQLRDYRQIARINDSDDPTATAREVGQMLADWNDPDRVARWVEGAHALAGDKGRQWLLSPLRNLGAIAEPAQAVSIARSLLKNRRALLAGRLFRQPMQALRRVPDGDTMVTTTVENLLNAAANDADRRTFLADLYFENDPALAAEFALFEGRLTTIWADPSTRGTLFDCLTRLWRVDGPRFVKLADRAWAGLELDDRRFALQRFLQWALPEPNEVPEECVARWVLDRFESLPDLGAVSAPSRRTDPARLDFNVKRMVRALLNQQPWQWLDDLLRARLATKQDADDFSVLSSGFAAKALLRPYTPADAEAAASLAHLLASEGPRDATLYLYGPPLLAEIDPTGTAIMPVIAHAIDAIAVDADHKSVLRWARLVSGWGEGTQPWRVGAEAACRWAARQLDLETRRSVWSHLFDGSTGVLMGREAFLNRFASQAKAFETLLADEKVSAMRAYWQQRVEWARSGYNAEVRRLEEDEWLELA